MTVNQNRTIPKIIHYCWFGGNEKPELVTKCIESWKKYLSDYEIREWNDSDMANCENQYAKDAYKEKIWAFVSDYFRLYALYNYGGLYLDTDEEVLKSFDNFSELDFYACAEEHDKQFRPLSMGLIGAKQGNSFIKDLLDTYDKISLYDTDGKINYYSITERFKKYLYENYEIPKKIDKKTKIVLKPNHIIFPSNYFCNYEENISYAIHHYCGSWSPELREKKSIRLLGNIYLKIYAMKPKTILKQLKELKEFPVFGYPRYKQYTVVITIGKKGNE